MTCPYDVLNADCEYRIPIAGGGLLLMGLGMAYGECCFLTSILALILGGAAMGFWYAQRCAACPSKRVNAKINLTSDKVVHTTDIEDITDQAAFCRCWKSDKFPYCDGSHVKHNKETGDNVGPMIVKKKEG